MAKPNVNLNQMSEFYDKRYEGSYMEEHSRIEIIQVRHVLNFIPKEPATILDYGCGQGVWIGMLHEVFPNVEIVGVDISKNAIEKARNRFPQYKFLAMEGNSAPLEGESFDLVFSYHVLEHVVYLHETLSDMSKLLKPDGVLCLILPCGNPHSFEYKVCTLTVNGIETLEDGKKRFFFEDEGHLRRITSDDLVRKLKPYNLLLVNQFFSNQMFGAMYWIGNSTPNFISKIFNPSRGKCTLSKIKLLLLKVIFLSISVVLRLSNIQRRQSDIPSKKVIIGVLFPIIILSKIFRGLFSFLAINEWNLRKNSKNGSAMFLIFRKGRYM